MDCPDLRPEFALHDLQRYSYEPKDRKQISTLLEYAMVEQSKRGNTASCLGLEAVTTLPAGTRVVILYSGGLDSATLMTLCSTILNLDVIAVEFQGHDRTAESICAKRLTKRLSIHHTTLLYPTTGTDITMPLLPERYSVYLVTAAALASELRGRVVLTGLIHDDWTKGDTAGASPAIIKAVNVLLHTEHPSTNPTVAAPFAHLSKQTVAAFSLALGLNEQDSVSCEAPGKYVPCRQCGQCEAREKAMKAARKLLIPN